MIKCEGHSTMLSGSQYEVIQDFVNIIASMRKSLNEKFSPEVSDRLIAICGELAFAVSDGNEEQEQQIVKVMLETISAD